VLKAARAGFTLKGIPAHGIDRVALILGRAAHAQDLAGATQRLGGSGALNLNLPSIPNLPLPTSVPLTGAQQLRLNLARSPNNVSFLGQQAAHDRAAIVFAAKLRQRGTISNQKYLHEVTGYEADLNATLSTIAGITSANAAKAKDARLKAGQFT